MFTINYKGDICFPNLPLDLGFKYGKGMATVASNGGILLCGGESNFNGEVCTQIFLQRISKNCTIITFFHCNFLSAVFGFIKIVLVNRPVVLEISSIAE